MRNEDLFGLDGGCVHLWTGNDRMCLELSTLVSMRLDLSMTIVCMVNSTAVNPQTVEGWANGTNDGICPMSSRGEENRGYNGHLEWTPSMQALLLSTTYYGGMLTITFSGHCADVFGPKRILIAAVIIYVTVSLLTPLLAKTSYFAVFGARVIMGLAEGFVFPAGTSVVGRWFTPHEKSTAASFYTSGNQIAACLTSFVSARLCDSSFEWPAIFYFFGAVGVVWALAWIVVFSNSPEENRWISEEEKEFLKNAIKKPTKSSIPIQWAKLTTSGPLLVAVLVQFAYNFQIATFQALLPTYFKEELKISLTKNGFYSMVPFITEMVSKITFSLLADMLKRRKILSPTVCCKAFQTIGSFGCALVMLGLAMFPSCQRVTVAIVLLGFFGMFISCGIPGFFTSLLCLDPHRGGLLASIAMILGMVGNIGGPLMITLLDNIAPEYKWTCVFLISAALNVIVGTLFFLFGSAKAQPWSHQESLKHSEVFEVKDALCSPPNPSKIFV